MEINQFNKTNLKTIREKLDGKLKELSEELGITIESKNFSFSTNELDMKLKATITGEMTQEMIAIRWASELELGVRLEYGYSLQIDNLGDVKLVAYKSRSPKYPWVIELKDGCLYKISSEELKRELIKNKKVA